MSGKSITTQQVEIYMMARKANFTQVVAAAKAGISERSARNIDHGKHKPNSSRHDWRTRKDPLMDVWECDIVPMLKQEPALTPITLLEVLQEKYPGLYSDEILRTLQRRVRQWKALYGPDKEVIFRQTHEPGRLGLSDFTHLKGVIITINSKPLTHLIYHFRLAYSGWSYMKIILGGESYTALAEGLQEAIWRLGGAPLEHRTDSLSAAFKNLKQDEQNDITERYRMFCEHYGIQASRNNPGVSHENGSIESPHGHLKRRIGQALLLRKSYNFESLEDYQNWLENVVSQHNRRNAKLIAIDKESLQALPLYKTADYTEISVKVTTSSTIDVRRATYTVPSRLQGETLRVHLYHDRLLCYLGSTEVISLKRVYSQGSKRSRVVDYRHVINSLIRKPQAFRYSRLRDDLLPNESYRQIWEYVNRKMPSKLACKFIVGLLHLASETDCEDEIAEDTLLMIANNRNLALNQLQNKYQPRNSRLPINIQLVDVLQHNLNSYNHLIVMEAPHA